ncbi:MAG: RICIN domain-containing protein [Clostridia bacterium]|nr:RICIN domain-containing protein [Clostridia bacterium]
MHTGKSLTVQNDEIKEGTQIIQSDYQGKDSQKWILRDSHKNGWIISSFVNSDLSISVKDNIENGARIVLEKTIDNDSQMFYMYNIVQEERTKNDGIYKFSIGKNPNKVIEIQGGTIENDSEIDIWTYRKCIATKILFRISKRRIL